MLVDLDNTQAPVIIFIGNGFDAGRFTGSRITEQQAVVGLFTVYKSLGIVYQFFLGKLVTYQIIQFHMGNVQNRNDMYTLLVMGNAEGLVQAEFADTVFLIELGQCSLHLLGRSVCAELFRQFTDAGTNSLIVHLALLHAAGIIFNDGKFRHMKLLHHGCKIKIIEFLENADVMQCRIVDGTDDLSADLAATAVAVLVIHQEIGQIAVPQIPVETVIACQIDQIMNALVKQCRHIFRVVIFVIVMGHEERHVIQQFSVLEITVYDQFFFSHMSNLLVLYVLTIQSQWAK